MTNSSNDSGDRAWYLQRFAIESQSKYVYFMVGLTFAILGLSIETTDNPTWLTQIAWVFLLTSALWGIFKIQWDPVFAKLNASKLEEGRSVTQLQEAMLKGMTLINPSTGKVWTPEELGKHIMNKTKMVNNFDQKLDKISRENTWRFRIHTWSFIAGLFTLAIDKIF